VVRPLYGLLGIKGLITVAKQRLCWTVYFYIPIYNCYTIHFTQQGRDEMKCTSFIYNATKLLPAYCF